MALRLRFFTNNHTAISEQVTADKPLGVEMLGMRLSLFRDANGVVRAVSDVCPHRGAPLSKGWVEKQNGHNCVVCPYHGVCSDGGGWGELWVFMVVHIVCILCVCVCICVCVYCMALMNDHYL